MTADERLARIFTKIDRAKKHYHDLRLEVQAFINSNPYKINSKRDPKSRRVVYYLLEVQETPPLIAAIMGDILQNLRSAMDHLAYQLVDIGTKGKGPFEHVYFPISMDETRYRKKQLKRMGMQQEAIKAIDSLNHTEEGTIYSGIFII